MRESTDDAENAPAFETAREAAVGMGVGWTLGNTYDCHGTWFDSVRTETSWGNPIVTRDFIRFVAKTGFGAVRVPVTWYPHMDADGIIQEEWLRRVRRTVRMVIAEGMYCIIDSKHDTGSMRMYGGGWISAERENFTQNAERVRSMWRQIATYFSEESEKLLFEGFSELIDKECDWDMPSAAEMEVVNDWNQLFVDTVRATGGANAQRNLIICPYGGGSSEYLLSGFVLPKDTVPDRLIVGVRMYTPIGFTSRTATWARQTDEFDCLCEEELQRAFEALDRNPTTEGVPLMIMEYGAMDRSNAGQRARYAAAVVSHARVRKMPCFYWDDGVCYDILNRNTLTVRYPEIVTAIVSSGRTGGE